VNRGRLANQRMNATYSEVTALAARKRRAGGCADYRGRQAHTLHDEELA